MRPRASPCSMSQRARHSFVLADAAPHEVLVGTVILAPAGFHRGEISTPDAYRELSRRGFVLGHDELSRRAALRVLVASDDGDQGLRYRPAVAAALHAVLAGNFPGQCPAANDVAARNQAAGRSRRRDSLAACRPANLRPAMDQQTFGHQSPSKKLLLR